MLTVLCVKSKSEIDLDNMRLRCALADACLEVCKSDRTKINDYVYSAWTHLAKIPELCVDLAKYDSLQFNRQTPDYKAYSDATNMLDKLRSLISAKEVQVYEELYK